MKETAQAFLGGIINDIVSGGSAEEQELAARASEHLLEPAYILEGAITRPSWG